MKKKISTRVVSVMLTLLMVVSIIPMGTIGASAGNGVWASNYKYWGQYSSADHQMDYWGCWVTADAKLIYETGINRSSSFNPDVLKDWYKSHGCLNSGFYKTGNSASHIVKYANSLGNYDLKYLGQTTYNCVEKVKSNIANGYYSIIKVNGGGHYVLVSNQDSINHDNVWIYESISTKYDNCQNGSRPKANPYKINAVYTYSYANSVKPEPPKPPIPNTPSVLLSATKIAQGDAVTVSWNAVTNAESYVLGLSSTTGYTEEINVGNATSKTVTLSAEETMSFRVYAKNSTGASSWSSYQSCTAYGPSTVTFTDWDGTVLQTSTVAYGKSAQPPASPTRDGYSFQGWSDSYYNVTSDKTIQALYKINTYTVNFYDYNNKLITSEKAEYLQSVTPPTEVNVPEGYEFYGWDSTAYQNVFTKADNKVINVHGIYNWSNADLPVTCNITSASRQPDGYYVTFDLTNYPDAITRGRAVVSLKTESGKLVDMTESAAFSLPKGTIGEITKAGMEVFIPCEKAASQIEIIIVDSYSSGVPISKPVTSEINQALMWSDWSSVQPANPDGTLEIESRLEYRYRDKEFSTGNTKTKDGWTYTGSRTEQVGDWSAWGWNYIGSYDTESQKREVQTQSAISSYNYEHRYNYWRYAANWSGGYSSRTWTSSKPNYYTYYFVDTPLTYDSNGYYRWYYNGSNYCALYASDPYETWVETSANYGTQYRYRDTNYVYGFYRWKDWSSWSTDVVTATDNREVETQTTYRYKSTAAGLEDDTGVQHTVSGQLDTALAGKQITLFVYKVDSASDYTNEYVGQSTVAEDGSYRFIFKLREEPSVKTGDFTVAIGIEGTTNTIVVDTIKAPKPTYTVNFYDWDGSIISTQHVEEGEDAVLPVNPTKEGYTFLGWDKSIANIQEDTDFYADFKKNEYTVVFVDWENQMIEVKTFEHGDVLTPPDYAQVEGYTFDCWDQIANGNVTVTQNMVVSAQYNVNTYTVKFLDYDNNVISTQEVEYGKDAVAPNGNGMTSEDGKQFAGWFNPEQYQNVDHDIVVLPSYYFEETAAVPTFSVTSGEFRDKVTLTLSTDDENDVIFYMINGDESEEKVYTGPITIDKTSSVTAYTTSFGKNDSETVTEYYCINNGDAPSAWMLYSELPSEVTANLSEYTLESETGYRFKDTQVVSTQSAAGALLAAGWTYESESYTAYTPWQDAEIAVDSNLFGFEVDTQVVADTSVTRYKYSHYKYTDDSGVERYAPSAVDGFTCTYETIILDTRLSIAGFLEDSTTYYNYNGAQWFTQTKVSGEKTQYRSRYLERTYYKWTAWDIQSPSSNETRAYETDTVYRYANKNYHLLTVIDDYGYPNVYMVQEGSGIPNSAITQCDGYDFEGFYIDEEFTSARSLSEPITESLTVFAKYIPKKYTVVFQMMDGTELDTQTVEYMSPATEPDTDSVPGYVFGGWDKDFDCIVEDTVVTAKYFKETEYTRVALNYSEFMLYAGTDFNLVVTVTPAAVANERVEWTSSDPKIASVDDTGRVSAVSHGKATITVTAPKTGESASCVVTVNPNVSTQIVLKDSTNLNHDDLGYLRRIGLKTPVSAIQGEFENLELHYYNMAGTELADSAYIGTGTEIRLTDGVNVLDTEVCVVTGDATGDGIINNRDVVLLNRMILQGNTADLKECQLLAMDVNGDGKINNRDAVIVAKYIVGKQAL